MKLAFCLFKYFPFGGLQRDFLRIAHECIKRGHEVHVYTMTWSGDLEPDLHIHVLKSLGITNHGRSRHFIKQLRKQLHHGHFDLVVGFNKMPGLDIYYAADVCYKARTENRSFFYRLSPRYREWVRQEESVFNAGNKTEIMLIAKRQQQEFVNHYQTESDRFHLLPPGIAKDRVRPANAVEIRAKTRHARQIGDHEFMVLMIGSGFETKGVDRAVRAFAAMPEQLRNRGYLYVIGADNPDPFIALASQLEVKDRIHFLGGRSDVPDFLLAADLLIHPAYYDNTATVLLEAVVAGLPVLTTDQCGYAQYVLEAKAGMVLDAPFEQAKLNKALVDMITSPEARASWQENALIFAREADIYSMPQKAVDIIEEAGRRCEFLSPS